jgi:hypothetical protein
LLEAAFQRWMERDRVRWSNPDSIGSYLSGRRQVEKRGRVDLDAEFQRDRLESVLATLDRAAAGDIAGWPAPKTVSNYRSHVEAYAEFSAERA